MIPTNKRIAVLHPYVNKVWWAVKMMIYLSNFLQEKNDLIFYTFSYNKEIFSEENINFRIKSYLWDRILKFINFFLVAFDIRKSDYIIIWNSPMHFVWVISKILFFSKAKLIWWNHHYPWYYTNNTNLFLGLKQYIEKLFIKKIDLILSNSKSVKAFIDNIWNIDSKLLYPVLDYDFRQGMSKKIINNNNVIFTYWRRVKGKNLQLVFKTYEDLKDKINNLVLVIGWDWDELQVFTEEYAPKEVPLGHKNNSNVKILWSLAKQQILENLNKSDVFLFPSQIDSFWLVKLEAMSIWNPVICLDNFWNEEIVDNNINGFCVKTENDFIEKTYLVLTNSKLRNELSKNAYEKSKVFSGQLFEKQLEDIFGEINN